MTKQAINTQHHMTFESIKHIDEHGNEYWFARELAPLLDYQAVKNFFQVIDKAKIACKHAGYDVADHIVDVTNIVEIGSGAKRSLRDVRLSRYACYLIVQNGDPSKPVIANGQTYFAVQARRQELQDEANFRSLSEDERRLVLRGELSQQNRSLVTAVQHAGVETALDYAVFQDHGYKGLYGGIGAKEIHRNKGLKKSQKILDHMSSAELAANLFRATQAEEKLKRENVRGKTKANSTHYEVGVKVRKTMEELGSVMPENMPTPDKSIQQVENQKARLAA